MDANEIRVEGFKYRVISIFPDGSYTNKPQGLVAEALYSDRVVGRSIILITGLKYLVLVLQGR